jgi:hypothetical protein
MNLRVDEKASEIRHIMDQARREYKYEQLIKNIDVNYSNMKLEIIKLKITDGSQLFILSEFDVILDSLDDDIVNLEIF